MTRVLFTVALIIGVNFCFAQTAPQSLNYQAVARNANGLILPVTNINVRFSILDASITGNTIYQETHATSTNNFGLFTLAVGKGIVVSGTFSSIDWGGGDKFLKVEVAPNGDNNYLIQGATQLLSVPYALFAEKTKLVAGTGISINNGNTISTALVAGTGISINGSTISATTNGFWIQDPNGINYQAGNVGIRRLSAANIALSISQQNTGGSSAAMDISGDDTWQTVVRLRNNAYVGREYQLQVAGPGNNDLTPRAFALYHGTSNGANPAFILNTDGSDNGYLAVGSYNYRAQVPRSRLHVFNGDVNIEDIGRGIIMKSPNGQCWRVTVSNTGTLVTTSIACPN
jgi:hypothetical protein